MRIFGQIASICIALCLLSLSSASALTCRQAAIPDPCGAHHEPSSPMTWGNPIQVQTGEKWQHDIDLPAHPHWPGLSRYYVSRSRPPTASMGAHYWSLSYDSQLLPHAQDWLLRHADGSTQWLRSQDIRTHAEPHIQWRWHDPKGRIWDFDEHGWLIVFSAPPAAPVRIERYTTGPLQHAIQRLSYVDQAYALSMHYHPITQHLQEVRTPLGSFQYRYDAHQRLRAVERPDGLQRLYSYPDPASSTPHYALTGLSIQSGDTQLPLHQWHYHPSQGVQGGHTASQAHSWTLHRDTQHSTLKQGAQTRRWSFSTTGQLTDYAHQACTNCPWHHHEQKMDAYGRLVQARDWTIERAPNGHMTALHKPDSPWGPLQLRFNTQGLLQQWSGPTGAYTRHYDSQGRLLHSQHTEHSHLHVRYEAGRPATIHYQHQEQTLELKLSWAGADVFKIEHPEETQWLTLDTSRQQVLHRRVQRSQYGMDYEERFRYDARQRLIEHALPEGGHLHYVWGPQDRLQSISWTDDQGQSHVIVHSQIGHAGYKWGNGLAAVSKLNAQAQAVRHSIYRPHHPIWEQERQYGQHGQVIQERYWHASREPSVKQYAYDAALRLVAEQSAQQQTWWAWDSTGRAYATSPALETAIDTADLPAYVGTWQLQYAAQRRLQRIYTDTLTLAHYTHDAFGQRIYKQSQHEQTGYLYHDHKLVAEYTLLTAHDSRIRLQRRYIYAHHVPVAMLLYDEQGQAQIFAIHSDLMGAPRLLSDSHGNIVWEADYTAWGQAQLKNEHLSFNLRLPGQYFDQESGWHDNLLRTYLPDRGHYLDIDPLGPLPTPGSQARGYAQQQPLRYIDPLGLILFAFDGTRMGAGSNSNVWKLAQLYADGPSHYQSGPGNSYYLEWDAILAWNARQILENQWQFLLNAIERHRTDAAPLPIDILGYSRGAALAREFANRILEHTQAGLFELYHPQRGWLRSCVDVRFIGLFDTVAQFGLHGSHNHLYRLGVSSAWQWVAHAVALHEHRHLFPLSAINNTDNTVEAPFIGAHGDIGGGVLADALPVTDLDKVALAWMHWQARAAGLTMHELPAADQHIEQAILRDSRPAFLRYLQNGDRQLLYHGHGKDLPYQDQHPRLGRATRDEVEPIIQRYLDWRTRSDEQVGELDMHAYSLWLDQTHGWSP